MINIIKEQNIDKNAFFFWITIKSYFRARTIDTLLQNSHVLGVRYNLSKETNMQQLAKSIRYINREYPKIRIMLDFGGCKQRIKVIDEPLAIIKDNGYVICKEEEMDEKSSNAFGVSEFLFNYIIEYCHVGDYILVSDGWQQFRITDIHNDKIACKAVLNSKLYNNRGISVKGLYDKMEQRYDNDLLKYKDLSESCTIHDIALSFVSKSDLVLNAKKQIPDNINVISKIESIGGLNNIFSITQISDEIMIARGDLLVEIFYDAIDLFKVEEYISSCCRMFNKNYIIATRIADALETDDYMTIDEILVLYTNLYRYSNPIFLLSAEISHDEGKAILNLNTITNNINKILTCYEFIK